ncbi:MAG: tRNA glutamyl-Q(34) synthetase GluQRS [Alphaproteobacteria bacterium]|nr:tRNA glutamyl-Q(34) synthetase GluQRS [Alphaproteobacteria bacterium]
MIITRFAPSPTGHLHLGHAYSALRAYQAAAEQGGEFLLRIEDIDPVRCKPEYIADLMEDLRWLGLKWEEPVRLQSEHLEDYRAALDRLRAMGVLYPCFCTRGEVAKEAAAASSAPHVGEEGPVYSGTCRKLSRQEREKLLVERPAVWRLDMEKACALTGPLAWVDRERGAMTAHPEAFGDVVLARKDVPTSYHLSVTVDDHLQGVNLVARGEDLLRATDIHRLLQALLGCETPEYYHHKLLLDASGKRYAKRDKAVTLLSLRANGKTPEEVRAMAGL